MNDMKRKPKKNQDDSDSMSEEESDEHFAYIAGYTSGGAPFGTTWEEMAEMEKREAEFAAIRRDRPRRTIRVDMNELEFAFESFDDPFRHYLDTESGKCVALPGYDDDLDLSDEMEAEIELVESAPLGRFLLLETDADFRPSIDDALEFAGSVGDERFRNRLKGALGQHGGAFRRFLNVLHEEAGEIERWHHFRRQRLRENIVEHLKAEGLDITYEPLPAYQSRNDARKHLLAGARAFIDRVKSIAGVERIALIGSIATSKKEPNDIDLLVTITTKAIVPEIAAAGRKLKGHAQTINRAADIFLATPNSEYLGRTCPWRECGPGIRTRCHAQHCGGHLYDDLQVLTLKRELLAEPPLEVFPKVVVRQEIPGDVMEAFGIVR